MACLNQIFNNWIEKNQEKAYDEELKSSGAAYGGDPQNVVSC